MRIWAVKTLYFYNEVQSTWMWVQYTIMQLIKPFAYPIKRFKQVAPWSVDRIIRYAVPKVQFPVCDM